MDDTAGAGESRPRPGPGSDRFVRPFQSVRIVPVFVSNVPITDGIGAESSQKIGRPFTIIGVILSTDQPSKALRVSFGYICCDVGSDNDTVGAYDVAYKGGGDIYSTPPSGVHMVVNQLKFDNLHTFVNEGEARLYIRVLNNSGAIASVAAAFIIDEAPQSQ